MDIPKPILDGCLPNPLISVISLLQHPPPNISSDIPDIPVDSILSSQPSYFTEYDASRILLTVSSLVVPPIKFVQDLYNTITTNTAYSSFAYHCSGSQLLLPFWVVNLWLEQHSVAHAQATWSRAVQWVNGLPTAHEWMGMLTSIPWKYELPRAC
ncbi:hypothetical protein AGABI2DRAFT_117927 [Agaricus bisporus var. bisporus H97]|uniref:hypothetical protein n=1 Tax=Agaricus bisporus var. bisporus (strain H97 / ATCC MYA-4626 / FGSC 10389) TaxID=936046 RepID=UPI00029F601A|nr:hypothetical protein AGABI2DRAFT_117927 [Agaricus bisporus var. bisporus H97]EKV47350.1 hypothetical protein AGABI2DRAFT_117927 [Agaricus bisporus var. bisporus H97]